MYVRMYVRMHVFLMYICMYVRTSSSNAGACQKSKTLVRGWMVKIATPGTSSLICSVRVTLGRHGIRIGSLLQAKAAIEIHRRLLLETVRLDERSSGSAGIFAEFSLEDEDCRMVGSGHFFVLSPDIWRRTSETAAGRERPTGVFWIQ